MGGAAEGSVGEAPGVRAGWSCFEELPWMARKYSEQLHCWDHLYIRAVDLQELRVRGIHCTGTSTLSDVFLHQKQLCLSSSREARQAGLSAMVSFIAVLTLGQICSIASMRPPCPQSQQGGRQHVCVCAHTL